MEGARKQRRDGSSHELFDAAFLAWSVCAASLLLMAFSLLLTVLGWPTPLPKGWDFSWPDQAVSIVGILGAPILGGLIASRRPTNSYGWLWLGFGLGFALTGFAQVYAAYALEVEPGSLPAPRVVGTVVAGTTWVVGVAFAPLLMLRAVAALEVRGMGDSCGGGGVTDRRSVHRSERLRAGRKPLRRSRHCR